MNKVSVLMPAFNAERFIGEAIESCIESLDDPEILVVNDGSTDDTQKIIAKFAKFHAVKAFVFERNRGKVSAFNKAFSEATGDVITLCAADDIMLPGRNVLSQVRIDQDQPQFFIGDVDIVDVNLEPINKRMMPVVQWPKILERNYYSGGAVAFNSRFAKYVFPLPPDMKSEDYFLALTACLLRCEIKIHEEFIKYRQHDGGTWGVIRRGELIRNVALRNVGLIRSFAERQVCHVSREKSREFMKDVEAAIEYNAALGGKWTVKNLLLAISLPRFYSAKSRVRLAAGAEIFSYMSHLNEYFSHHHRP